MKHITNFETIDGIMIEKEFAENTFFMDNIFKNRFINSYYNAFYLFIVTELQKNYPELQASYNRAINLLDQEDQIIIDTIIFLYKEKEDFSLETNNISEFHIDELEKGYSFIINQIKQY